MIKLKDLLMESVGDVKTMTYGEFESKGGYNIGVGSQGKLYTLRYDWMDTVGVYEGPYGSKTSKQVRRSHHTRNLGKKWEEVVVKLPDLLKGEKVFVPGFAGKVLIPHSEPVPVVVPTKFPFGKFKGMSIEAVSKEEGGIDYLLWVSMEFHSSKKEWQGFVQDIRLYLGDTLDKHLKKLEKEQKVKEKSRDKMKKKYAPLAKFLRDLPYPSGFTDSIARQLEDSGEPPLGRGGRIVMDIYGKWYGGKTRRNSKEYNDNTDEFFNTYVKGVEDEWRW